MTNSDVEIEEQSVDVETVIKTEKKSVTEVKTKKRKIKKIFAYVFLIGVGILLILSMSLGFIIKNGINHFLPPLTGTDVSMESCFLNPFTGSVSIKNFVIGNPKGYKSKYAFKLNEIYVNLDMGSLLSDKLIIQEIFVDGMDVSVETNMVETNIGVIKDNIDKAVNGDKSVDVDSTEEEVEVTDTAETTEDKSGGGKKIQIDDFKFINSHVIFAVHLKESGTQESVLLPDVIITDIGADSPDGATVSEISGIVINELYIAILKAAKGVTSENFNKSVNKGIEKIKEGTKEMIKGVKNIFGSDE